MLKSTEYTLMQLLFYGISGNRVSEQGSPKLESSTYIMPLKLILNLELGVVNKLGKIAKNLT